jgi:hypothetical protein
VPTFLQRWGALAGFEGETDAAQTLEVARMAENERDPRYAGRERGCGAKGTGAATGSGEMRTRPSERHPGLAVHEHLAQGLKQKSMLALVAYSDPDILAKALAL